MFDEREKIALFIDGANLYATAKSLGFDIDYKRLLLEFQSKGYLLRAYYYTALADDQEYSSIRPLIDWLDYNGYTVVTKPTKEFVDSTGRRKIKGNMDIELAVHAMEMSESIDHFVLFSGDGDFRSLVEALQRKGKKVSVISTLTTQPPMIADELRRQADHFVDLATLRAQIGRDPAERAQRQAERVQLRRASPTSSRTTRRSERRSPAVGMDLPEPGRDCPLCPRLVAFRETWRAAEPSWHNAPVPTFGAADARLLIVGLAPGLRGANRTGRPFTGDYAGDLLYRTLIEFGFATGSYAAQPGRRPDPRRCRDHQRRPLRSAGEQAAAGRDQDLPPVPFRHDRGDAAPARQSSRSAASPMIRPWPPLGFGARRDPLPTARFIAAGGHRTLHDSYHCSRYNTNTGVLTEEMFRAVFAEVRRRLDS